MSRLTDYMPEISGIAFEDPFDAIIDKALSGATATPTAKATSTPSPSSRVRQFADGKWYVVDANLNPVSEGFRTQAMATTESERLTKAGTFAAPTAAPTSTPASAPEGGGGVWNLARDLATGVMTQAQSSALGTGEATSAPTPPPPQAAPRTSSTGGGSTSSSGGGGGSSGGSGGGGSTAAAKATRKYPNTSAKTLFEWLHAGRITQDDLVAELSIAGWSPDEIRFAFEDNQPEPKPKTMMDILGPGGETSQKFNIQREGFGTGPNMAPGLEADGTYEGIATGTTPGGQTFGSGAWANSQFFTPGSLNNLTDQMGLYSGGSSFANSLQAVGNIVARREALMALNPALTPAKAHELALMEIAPANPKHDPTIAAAADMSDPLKAEYGMPTFFQAQGGTNVAGALPFQGYIKPTDQTAHEFEAVRQKRLNGILVPTDYGLNGLRLTNNLSMPSYNDIMGIPARPHDLNLPVRPFVPAWARGRYLAGSYQPLMPPPEDPLPPTPPMMPMMQNQGGENYVGMNQGGVGATGMNGFSAPGEVGMFSLDQMGNPGDLLAVTGEGPDGIGGMTSPEQITVSPMGGGMADPLAGGMPGMGGMPAPMGMGMGMGMAQPQVIVIPPGGTELVDPLAIVNEIRRKRVA
jgi:hypothetical protein